MVNLSSIVIGVTDLHRAKDFYAKLFNTEFEEFRPPFASFILGGIEFNLEQDSSDRDATWSEMYIGGRKSFSISTDNINVFLELAVSLGAKTIVPVHDTTWGWREAVIADLDNNEFVVEQKL